MKALIMVCSPDSLTQKILPPGSQPQQDGDDSQSPAKGYTLVHLLAEGCGKMGKNLAEKRAHLMWNLLMKIIDFRKDVVAFLAEKTANDKTAWEIGIGPETCDQTMLALWAAGSHTKCYCSKPNPVIQNKVKDLCSLFEDQWRDWWDFWIRKQHVQHKPNSLNRNAKCFSEEKCPLASLAHTTKSIRAPTQTWNP